MSITEESIVDNQTIVEAEIQKKFDEQEAGFAKTLECHRVLREFFTKHREAIAPFHWKAYGWCDTEVEFDSFQNRGREKELARALGKDGWTRHKNSYACGSIDWKKDLDGCHLIIRGAEQMSPKLIDEVKL